MCNIDYWSMNRSNKVIFSEKYDLVYYVLFYYRKNKCVKEEFDIWVVKYLW